MSYLDRLGARVEAVGTCLCLGIDPDPAHLPPGYPADVDGVERFAGLLLGSAVRFAAAVKVNLAFFEAYGSVGLAALERLRAQIPADVPFIADAKRGDIPSTSERHAVAIFDALGADAVTASPYLGRDAIAPLLERRDRFVYVLCRTSNAGAGEIQDLQVDGMPIYVEIAKKVIGWGGESDNVGLVVGATAPTELARVRAVAPGLPILVPGVGAQGGDVEAVLRDGEGTAAPAAAVRGRGLLVNVSRAIAAAALEGADPPAAIAAAAEGWADVLRC